MRILIMWQGPWGQRIIDHVRLCCPPDWTVETVAVARRLPTLIDEPEAFLPSDVPPADLLLALSESEGAAQLVTDLARLCGAGAVVLPVDSPEWLPRGLQNQVGGELAAAGVTPVFPRTFCTLTEDSAGFGRLAKQYDNAVIAAFARRFGRPRLKLSLDLSGQTISGVEVERSAPCGSTHHAARKLIGMRVDEAVPRAGLIVHQFPCLASMAMDETDAGVFEPLMSVSGHVINQEVERRLKSPA